MSVTHATSGAYYSNAPKRSARRETCGASRSSCGSGDAAARRARAVVHQPRHSFATRPVAAVHQFGVDAGTAVPLPTLAMDSGDLEPEPLVGLRVDRGRALLPGTESSARHAERRAQRTNGKVGLLHGDEPQRHAFSLARRPRLCSESSPSIGSWVHRGFMPPGRARRGSLGAQASGRHAGAHDRRVDARSSPLPDRCSSPAA